MALKDKFVVRLTTVQRTELEQLVATGTHAAATLTRARLLLKADVVHDGWPDERIADALEISRATVARLRKKFVRHGLTAALARKRPTGRQYRKLDGAQEARLITLACSTPPEGRERWTLQLLADKLVELRVVDAISDDTVQRTLEKNAVKPWLKAQWVLPPEASADFVCGMENVLAVYARPYDPKRPVVGCDEASKQLVADVRQALPMAPGQPQRLDYEYERRGTANLFMVFEPLAGQRHVTVTAQRTKADFARLLQQIADVWYPHAARITLVVDNLNTHKPSVLYEVFTPLEARRILERLEFVYTPKHASWLNVAELELSVLARQCLDRRLGSQEELRREVDAWERQRNAALVKVDWQFTTDDARVKLKRLYPVLEPVNSAEMNH